MTFGKSTPADPRLKVKCTGVRGGCGVQEEPGAWEDGFDISTGRKSRGEDCGEERRVQEAVGASCADAMGAGSCAYWTAAAAWWVACRLDEAGL